MQKMEFIKYLQLERRYSEYTLLAYQKDLEQFIAFIEDEGQGLWPENQITFQNIRTWIAHLNNSDYSERSINRKITVLRSYFKFLKFRNVIEVNPMVKIKALKQPKNLITDIPEKDLIALFNETTFENDVEGGRNRLILEMFYLTGMRRSELINIKVSDVNFSENSVKVLGKGNKERIVLFTEEYGADLQNYIRLKNMEMEKASPYLFTTKSKKKLNATLVYKMVNKYLSQVSSSQKKSPHVLRHSFATHMLNKGADLNTIKELLGHANLNATQIYTHTSIEKLKLVYNQTHPRSRN